jgi:hypothetical protein
MVQPPIRWRFKQIRHLTVGEVGERTRVISVRTWVGAPLSQGCGSSVPFASRLSPCIRGPAHPDPRQSLLHR